MRLESLPTLGRNKKKSSNTSLNKKLLPKPIPQNAPPFEDRKPLSADFYIPPVHNPLNITYSGEHISNTKDSNPQNRQFTLTSLQTKLTDSNLTQKLLEEPIPQNAPPFEDQKPSSLNINSLPDNRNQPITEIGATEQNTHVSNCEEYSIFLDRVLSRVHNMISNEQYTSIDNPLLEALIENWIPSVSSLGSKIEITAKSSFYSFKKSIHIKCGNSTFMYKLHIKSHSFLKEGRFEYISELGNEYLVEGKQVLPNGTIQEGRFKYYADGHRMDLVEGKSKYHNGLTLEGNFEYNPDAKMSVLIEGTMSDRNGRIRTGKFKYDPDTKSSILLEGTISHPN